MDSFSSSNSASGPDEGSSLTSKRPSLKRYKFLRILDSAKESERLVKHSNVLAEDDGNKWDWEIVTAILRVTSIAFGILIPFFSICIFFSPAQYLEMIVYSLS